MNHPLGMWQAMRKTLMMTAIAAVGAVAIHARRFQRSIILGIDQ